MVTESTMFNYFKSHIDNADSQKILYFGQSITADELLCATKKVATYLTKLGLSAGDTIAIALPNMPEAIMACYGINRMGAIANIMHPKLGTQAVESLLISTKTRAIFILNSIYHAHKASLDKLGIHAIVCYPSYFMPKSKKIWLSLVEKKCNAISFKDIMQTEPTFCDTAFSGQAPAVYIHSGGTSGEPKTVVLNSVAINSVASSIVNRVHGSDPSPANKGCFLMALPIFHCFGLAVAMHTGISFSSVVVLPQFKPKQAVNSIKKHRITHIMGVPQMYKKMLAVQSFCGYKLSQIGYVFCGGDTLPPSVRDSFNARMAVSGSNATILEGYGLTETASVLSIELPDQHPSQGALLAGNHMVVMDEHGVPCKTNEIGELYVSSSSLMLGYLGDDSQNNEVFTTIGNKRYLKSGDYGYLDDSANIHFIDRKKRSIKISAHNIFPAEVERIAKTLPMVADCVVARTTVGGKPATKMYVVLNKQCKLGHAIPAIKTAITSGISKYAVPLEFVEITTVARTKYGKVDFKSYEN